ncbi:hypothetical protein A2Y83_02070 [Candidatus Falkowbacteria bacterium RBG_13_39_14]|uniref:Uncharacterized protein n=1 Tax=Candidatus Falkowbacteria bacterium RBG_13_39_14 TaxID=1797985 RepID=A0A1F5S898_9BACT|nr:MAG: hypothetical protein A2Y83_02070 [Candidatus Falkowbacteria bacterium RBG_13_39_14]
MSGDFVPTVTMGSAVVFTKLRSRIFFRVPTVADGSIVFKFEGPACAGRRGFKAVEPEFALRGLEKFSKNSCRIWGSTAPFFRLPAQAGSSKMGTIEPSKLA